ncbi:hypothetical protein K443DRAFT_12321 [Laccaria amethystina LaAM-08-1]|uniref:Uncharacterized protein n=1 Tax=Laccaria amethystina LaAM-08-1 TaxID=1095629 RepID=A0A0C9WYX5_9AGAR|nr:hypothetical protein K443DRAFT_12321 [Laccaria amethystina LaAM-08-1]
MLSFHKEPSWRPPTSQVGSIGERLPLELWLFNNYAAAMQVVTPTQTALTDNPSPVILADLTSKTPDFDTIVLKLAKSPPAHLDVSYTEPTLLLNTYPPAHSYAEVLLLPSLALSSQTFAILLR